MLRFVRSIRTGDLFLYNKSLDEIAVLGVHSRSLQLCSLVPGPRARNDERASEIPGSL